MRLKYYLTESSPTKEMIEFYEKRTKEHIDRVRKNLYHIAEVRDDLNKVELMSRAKDHDKSKYSKKEREPYIWLTWIKKYGISSISMPTNEFQKINKSIDKAWKNHSKINKHHPEAHSDPNKMTDIDIAEMVADWASMSQELKTSLKEWADKNVGSKWKFDKEKTKLIYDLIGLFE